MGVNELKKVLFVATVVKKHINVFHLPLLEMFKKMGWETAVAARCDFDDPSECVISYCDRYYDIQFERSPFKLSNLKVYKQLKSLIDAGEYDIIHCHTPVAAMLARLAARGARKKAKTKLIYTAHGFHFYKGAPLLNWMLYYPVEKLCSRWTDTLVTINNEDYERACRMKAGRVVQVPGVGVDVDRFRLVSVDRDEVRRELGIDSGSKVLIFVGELNKNKNQTSLLDVTAKLCEVRSDIILLLVGAGDMEESLRRKAERLGIGDKVIFTGFRHDIPRLVGVSDICVPASFREGLPMNLIEAMAGGIPVVAYDNRGHRTIIRNGENGYIVPICDCTAMADRVNALLSDDELRAAITEKAHKTVEMYTVEKAVDAMKAVYGI